MPTKTNGWLAADGKVYTTVEEAQAADLGVLFAEQGHPLIAQILAHRAEVLEILTTGPTSRPGARKRAGTTAPKRAARQAAQNLGKALKSLLDDCSGKPKAATEAQVASGIKAMRMAVDEGESQADSDARNAAMEHAAA